MPLATTAIRKLQRMEDSLASTRMFPMALSRSVCTIGWHWVYRTSNSTDLIVPFLGWKRMCYSQPVAVDLKICRFTVDQEHREQISIGTNDGRTGLGATD